MIEELKKLIDVWKQEALGGDYGYSHAKAECAHELEAQLLAGATPEGWQAEVLQILSTDMQKAIDQWRGDDKVWSGLPILVGIWRDELNRIIKEIRKIRTPDAWQPIGTVPKDGRRVLAWFPRTGDSFAGTPTDDGPWYGPGGEEPTHWRPLPAPPAPASENKE